MDHRHKVREFCLKVVVALVCLAVITSVWFNWQQARAIQSFVRDFQSGDHETRTRATTGLLRARGSAIPELIPLLESENEYVRTQSAWILGTNGPKAAIAVPALIRGLDDECEVTRVCITRAIGQIGPAAVAAVPTLIRALRTDPENRDEILETLGYIGSETAVPALISQMGLDPRSEIRNHAAESLWRLGRAAVPALVKALEHCEADTRAWAAAALAMMESEARPAMRELEGVLGDQDIWVRVRAAWAVWHIDRRADLAIPVLAQALEPDQEWRVCVHASICLGMIGEEASPAVPALRRSLQSSDSRIRSSAAHALAYIGPKAVTAVNELVHALQDEDDNVRWSARFALHKIDPDKAASVDSD